MVPLPDRLAAAPIANLARRLFEGLLTAWAAISLTFFALRLSAGDPVASLLSQGLTTSEQAEALRQRLGYDLYAQRGRATRYIDVKSSLSLCSPTFTSREWQQARTHRQSYILAIIENFNPTGENIVFWVPDPYDSCTTREATAVQYSISRTSWRTAAATINEI